MDMAWLTENHMYFTDLEDDDYFWVNFDHF